MKTTSAIVVVVLVVLLVAASMASSYTIAKNEAESHGEVETFQTCVFDRGPFLLYGSKTPVYYATYVDGRKAYIAVTMFGTKIKFE